MTPLGLRVLVTEEFFAGPPSEWMDLPFGRARVTPGWSDLPEANRLLVTRPHLIPPHPGVLPDTLNTVFAARSVRSASVWIALEPPPGLATEAAIGAGVVPAAAQAADHDLRQLGGEPEARAILAGPCASGANPPGNPRDGRIGDSPLNGGDSPLSPPAGFALRPVVTDADWIALETIDAEAAAEREEPPARAARRTAWRRATAPATGCAWYLATLGGGAGAPAGFCGLLHEGPTARVLDLCERPVLRRRGVASGLVGALVGAAVAAPVDALAAPSASAEIETVGAILPIEDLDVLDPRLGLRVEGVLATWTLTL